MKKTFSFLIMGFCFFALFGQTSAENIVNESGRLAAVEGFIYGNVQQVGFRAFIFRQAIRYNLGGLISNQPDGSVHFFLQGEKDLMDKALVVIRKGPDKASVTRVQLDNRLIENGLTSVTVQGWTSASRDFTKPVDLVYPLRADNSEIQESEVSRIYKSIIRSAMDSIEGD